MDNLRPYEEQLVNEIKALPGIRMRRASDVKYQRKDHAPWLLLLRLHLSWNRKCENKPNNKG
jgi:hypothetical protein